MVGITEYSTYMNYSRSETMYKCIWFNARLCIVFECIAILQHVTVKRHFTWEHGYPYMCMFICTLQVFDLFDALHTQVTHITNISPYKHKVHGYWVTTIKWSSPCQLSLVR